jgi:hypothetical protein
MTKNIQAFLIHAEGLRRIVALRGGVENLGWNGYLMFRMNRYGFYIPSTLSTVKLKSARLEAYLSAREKRPQQRLTYPIPPLSPDLCQKILKFPMASANWLKMEF